MGHIPLPLPHPIVFWDRDRTGLGLLGWVGSSPGSSTCLYTATATTPALQVECQNLCHSFFCLHVSTCHCFPSCNHALPMPSLIHTLPSFPYLLYHSAYLLSFLPAYLSLPCLPACLATCHHVLLLCLLCHSATTIPNLQCPCLPSPTDTTPACLRACYPCLYTLPLDECTMTSSTFYFCCVLDLPS